MRRWGIIFAAGVLLLWPGTPKAAAAPGDEKSSTQLEAEYEREPNAKKRVKLALEISEERLKEVRAAYEAEDIRKGSEALEKYLAAVDRLQKAWEHSTGAGASKDAELRLRQQARTLDNLEMALSAEDRPPIEKAAARVAKLHETILHSIMNPPKGSAKQ